MPFVVQSWGGLLHPINWISKQKHALYPHSAIVLEAVLVYKWLCTCKAYKNVFRIIYWFVLIWLAHLHLQDMNYHHIISSYHHIWNISAQQRKHSLHTEMCSYTHTACIISSGREFPVAWGITAAHKPKVTTSNEKHWLQISLPRGVDAVTAAKEGQTPL